MPELSGLQYSAVIPEVNVSSEVKSKHRIGNIFNCMDTKQNALITVHTHCKI
jgi:hypothetical protein